MNLAEIKLKWQKHNRDHGLTWNEVGELVNEVAGVSCREQRIDTFEKIIVAWLKSGNENATHLAWLLEKEQEESTCKMCNKPIGEELFAICDDCWDGEQPKMTAEELLKEASKLVGNPGTNISGSTDVACMLWHEKYAKYLKA